MDKKEYVRLIYVITKDNPYKWELVREVNFGSVTKPNSEILQVKFCKIEKEEYEKLKRLGLL